MTDPAPPFDPEKYKSITRDTWDRSGAGYSAWDEAIVSLIAKPGERMMELAGIAPGSQVLELAAGPGAYTLMLAGRVGASGKVLATDLSPGILAFAEQKARAAGLAQVETRVMDGEAVEVPEASFDAAVSSLGLMFFPNPVKSVQGQLRAVKAGGRVAALVIGGPQTNPFFSIPAGIIRERAGLPLPQPGMPGPFALGAPGVVEDVFKRAGLRDVTTESFSQGLQMPSTAEFLRFLGDAFGALHMMMNSMDEDAKRATWEAVAAAMAQFEGPDGFRCPSEVIVCVGTR